MVCLSCLSSLSLWPANIRCSQYRTLINEDPKHFNIIHYRRKPIRATFIKIFILGKRKLRRTDFKMPTLQIWKVFAEWFWITWLLSKNRRQFTCTTSIPFATLPNTVCLLSNHGVATVVIKNWEPFVLGPAFAIETVNGLSCLKLYERKQKIITLKFHLNKNHTPGSFHLALAYSPN